MNHPHQNGFSLLEVVVAFSILSLALSVILAMFGTGLRSTILARDYQQALLLADTRLALLQGLPVQQLKTGMTQGDASGYIWKSEVLPIVQEPTEVSGIALYQLTVSVRWSEDEKPRQIELTTLRLGAPQ